MDVPPHDTNTNIETGGQRLKRTVNHNLFKNTDEITRYYYNKINSPEESSGVPGEKGLYVNHTMVQDICPPFYYTEYPVYLQVLSASSLCPLFNTNNNNIYYNNVTVSYGGDNFESGGEFHEFMGNLDYRGEVLQGNEILETPWTNFGWKTGLESKSTVFKLDNNGDKVILKEAINNYINDTASYYNEVVGYAVRKKYDIIIWGSPIIDNLDITKYKNISFWKYEKTSTVKQYDENGLNPVSTTTKYFFDNIHHLQLTRTESAMSNGDSLRTNMYYPDDLQQFPCKNKLLNQYRIAETIKEEEFIKSQNQNWLKISTTEINYKDWGNNIVQPEFIACSIYSNATEPRSRFYGIDSINGNPLEFSKEDDVHSSYIWGYGKTKQVIEGKNVSFSDLNTAVNLSTTNLENLLSSTEIGDLTSSTQRLKWKKFNDILRSQPLLLQAMVTTYTYKPLVGISSSTDSAGITTYYEYDTFGRLIYIRDGDYNILKKYDYHYAN